MKRLLVCVSLAAAGAAGAIPAAGAPKPAAKPPATSKTAHKIASRPCRVAPADEYFGRLKMSVLGIRNTIKDQGLRVDFEPGKADATMSSIALTEDAVHDWEHKYPCDSWIPGTIYALEHFYGKIHTNDGVKHVHATFAWLRKDYPRANILRVAVRENGQASVAAPPAPVVNAPMPAASATPAPAAAPAAPATIPLGR